MEDAGRRPEGGDKAAGPVHDATAEDGHGVSEVSSPHQAEADAGQDERRPPHSGSRQVASREPYQENAAVPAMAPAEVRPHGVEAGEERSFSTGEWCSGRAPDGTGPTESCDDRLDPWATPRKQKTTRLPPPKIAPG